MKKVKKVYYSYADVCGQVNEILRGMQQDAWCPDYVVGLTRGGLVPAAMISHYLEVPMETLKVNLRDNTQDGPESNCWMPEDAWGHNTKKKNILIVDDINDSGATLNWIKQDWESAVAGIIDPMSVHTSPGCIWHNNVRFATLINNEASDFKSVDYVAEYINKSDDPEWIVFPWEQWW